MEGTFLSKDFALATNGATWSWEKISLCGGGRTFGQDGQSKDAKQRKQIGVRTSTTSNERLHSTTPLIEREERELGHSCRHY